MYSYILPFLLCTSILASPTQTVLQLNPESSSESNDFDLTPTATYAFTGITTFHQLPSKACLMDTGLSDDILIIGFPFDTATSYRTGTRFGPNAIRQGSRAASLAGHYNYRQNINPFAQNISIVDCGDFPISPFDNALAFAQMEEWYTTLLSKEVKDTQFGIRSKKTGKLHPTLVALGGDHSISLPILRALHKFHGPVSVIHIDAHIDTWNPKVFAGSQGSPSKQAQFSDGTPYYWAGLEGLLTTSNIHAGIRSTLDSSNDLVTDSKTGFKIIPASDILLPSGIQGVIQKIRESVPHDKPVYVSLDIDSLDPAFAPGTAGPAAGGWSTGEVLQIIKDGLKDLRIVGVDVVEVLPGMDSSEITAIAAAELTFELITTLVKNGLDL